MGESLSENFPEIAAELDSVESGISAVDVHKGSGKKLWWLCDEGHSFAQRVVDRTKRGFSCPKCSGKVVWPGHTDLATKAPAALVWWDFDRNEVSPSEVMPSSNKKFWWKCPKGHSFDLSCNKMTQRYSCPVCANKRVVSGINDLATTNPEIAAEWLSHPKYGPTQVVANSHLKVTWLCPKGHEFQQIIGNRTRLGHGCPYCARQKSIRGLNDLTTLAPALAKEWHPTKNGSRIPSDYMIGSSYKAWWKCGRNHEWQAMIYDRAVSLYGCPFCSGRRVITGENDLQSKHPELVEEWDFERNKKQPSQIAPSSHHRAWWLCPEGHSYQAMTYSRIAGTGCPTCVNRQIETGYNDLVTLRPDLLEWWDFDKNTKHPGSLGPGSQQKAWWLCQNGHSFQSKIKEMAPKPRCPGCAKYGFNPEKDGYLYLLRDDRRGYEQIGITNDPNTRLALHRNNGWEVLDVRGPMDGYVLRELENSAKAFLYETAGRFTRSKNQGKFDGFTESWPSDNASFRNLEEFMKALREWETSES